MRIIVLLSFSACVAVASTAQTTYIWNGANPGDWQVATNWSPNGVPGLGDAVVITNGQPVLNADTPVADVSLSGGSLSGHGNLTVTGNFTWSGGTLNGRDYDPTAAVTITEDATLNIVGDANKGLRGRDIFNDGTMVWEGTGNLVVMWSTRVEIRPDATFELRTDAVLTRSNGTLVIQNDGLLVKTAGVGTTSFNYPYGQFNNTGTVRVEVGTLLLNNANASFSASGDGAFEIEDGATLRFNQAIYSFGAGSTVSGAGTLRTTGGLAQFGRAIMTGPTQVNGGSFRFSGTEPPSEFEDVTITGGAFGGIGVRNVNGTLTWTGGFLGRIGDGAGVLNLLGGVSAEGDAHKYFGGGTYNNASTFTWTGAGNLIVNRGGTFNNLAGATFDIRNDATWTRTNGSLTFINTGMVTKSAGDSTTTIEYPFGAFNNDGEIRIETGMLYVRNQTNSTDTGAWIVEDGARLRFNLHRRTFTETASLAGTGTLEFLGGTMINRGTVRPGLSAGALTVQGNYPLPQAAGVLEIELGGTEPGFEHDILEVTNTANLGGVLRLSLVDGFEPTGADTFTVVSALAVQGTFADVEPPTGYVVDTMYGGQAVTVVVSNSPVANEDVGEMREFAFNPPYPNPTTGRATLGFSLAEGGPVRLSVYDALGRKVAELLDEERAAGRYEVAFDGRALAAGLYFARLESGSSVAARPVMLSR